MLVKLYLNSFLIAVVAVLAARGSVVTDKQKAEANDIINYFTKGLGKGQTYEWLARFTDKYGQRYPPGKQYDLAADNLLSHLEAAGLDVKTEDVPGILNWYRGADPDNPDHAVLLKPRRHVIPVLALLNSTATPQNGGIKSAPVVVVRSFEELDDLPDSRINGSIVVYNQPWTGYTKTSLYRRIGGIEAAKRGAIAALVRSVTPYSLYTLHTGSMRSSTDSRLQIPVACITVEDAELLYRLQEAGHQLELSLQINSIYRGTVSRRTIIADLRGTTYPDEIVLFGGHFDSWDVGTGAMDDGGGVTITLHALLAMKALKLRPKRTIRAVFWTTEEFGYVGGDAYYQAHKHESSKMSLAMESDTGVFKPQGLHFSGTIAALKILQEVMDLLVPINATQLSYNDGEVPGDPEYFYEIDGVPSAELMTVGGDDRYFWYHHTEADMMTVLDSNELDACAALFATVSYVVADLDALLPHGKA